MSFRSPSGPPAPDPDRRPGPAPEEGPGRLSRRGIYDGRIVRLSVDTVRFPDGSTGELELIRHAGAAAVVAVAGPVDDPDPEILLIRQYRYASGGELLEVPAGMPDAPGEPWEACARRELEEETGYRAGELHHLTHLYTTPGFTDEVIHLFLATALEPGTADLDEDEFVEVVRVPFSRALAWVREGRIVDGKSMAALLWVATFLPELSRPGNRGGRGQD